MYGFYQRRVERKKKHQRLAFSFADGSNSFLKVSSNRGDVDAYVGDGGTAELHSQEGKHSRTVTSYATVFCFKAVILG